MTASTREAAICRMRRALDEYEIGPMATTIPLHRRVMDSAPFVEAQLDLHYLERLLSGTSNL